ncbi:MAG: hypothetical protein N2651_09280, partial [Fimbriimonadales bacterium]|nr:hypothetical protein [Fimbriimonadales bacterium]
NRRTRATETFENPLAPAFRMVGGCPYQGGLALLMRPARGNLPAQIVRWVSAKRLLTLTSLPEDVPLPPPIWLRFHRQRNSWLCAYRGVQINGEVPKTSLYEYSDQTGQLLREIPELAGAALGSGGALYVGGAGASSEGVVRVAPPEGLDSQRWLLVGVDAKERLYWYSQERTGR